MLTLTRKDMLLTINDNVIPAMGSSDVPVKFVNDTETYQGFLIEPRVGYYVNGCPKSGICEYDTSSNIIKIPAEAFKNKGILVIAIALIDNNDSNHIEVTKELALEVTPAPNGTVILPATDTWQTAVKNLVEQLYNQDYKPQFDEIEENLHNLVKEAQNQQSKANNQQTQIDNAIDVMGDYEIVQDNPTQIRFKKGDGTYGDTVNLGDNLASKSMVNAGYDTYSGNSYSGSASDYGIEIGKASGAYEQMTTNGYQLFDASKLVTTSKGGATVTNNGDGSFAVSGSGTLSTAFNQTLATPSTARKLKKGLLYVKSDMIVSPFLYIDIYWNDTWKRAISNKSSLVSQTEITQEDLDNGVNIKYRFYAGSGQTIKTGTVKPMLYQDGDGTWEKFTGGEPAPNPNYPLEPKFFEPKNGYSVGKNMFDKNNVVANNIVSGVDGTFLSQTGTYRTDYIDINSDFVSIFISGNKTSQTATSEVLAWYDNEKNFISGERMERNGVFPNKSYEIPSNASYVIFNFRNEDIDGIQLSYGSTEQPYTPFVGQSTTPLDITLRALPDGVCDTYENGVITRRVGYIEFDGSEDEAWEGWDLSGANNVYRFVITFSNAIKYNKGNNCLSNRFEYMSGNSDNEHFRWSSSSSTIDQFVIFINKNRLEDGKSASLKTWLQSNPIKVYYELSTPTTEKVTLPVIPSYFPYTNAWHDSPLQPQITWRVTLAGRTTVKKDEIVLTELDLNTERKANPTTVKVQLQDSEGKVLYLETSSENIYIQSGRFSGKTVQQVLENSIQAISATDEYIEVDVPDSMTQSIDEEFLVDEVDESETETE